MRPLLQNVNVFKAVIFQKLLRPAQESMLNPLEDQVYIDEVGGVQLSI